MVPWGPGTIFLLPWSNLFCLFQKIVWSERWHRCARSPFVWLLQLAVTARTNSGTYEKKDLKFGKKSFLLSNWVPKLTKRFFSLHISVFEFFPSILIALKGSIYRPESRALRCLRWFLRCMPFAGREVCIFPIIKGKLSDGAS